ncbi:MAG: dephospho-CoA kinase [Prevotella sp.]|jgi:dephospho-CoA kinase|nr:dephospho-CoA kinase [Prevotella sp.]
MNRHIAITGGIGSGKSYVCKLLQQRGISVYDCDAAAKRLMATSVELQNELSQLVGSEVFADGKLNKPIMAKFLLASDENRLAINNIVHPAVATDYMQSGIEWIESAILFDSGFDQRLPLTAIVCVTAPLTVRISRIMQRDNISKEQAEEWIAQQMPQEEVARLSNYVIVNDGESDLDQQIESILSDIYSKTEGV